MKPGPRIAIVTDGYRWYVRRVRVIEHDLRRDEMVYRCDKPLGNDYSTLDEATVAAAVALVRPAKQARRGSPAKREAGRP